MKYLFCVKKSFTALAAAVSIALLIIVTASCEDLFNKNGEPGNQNNFAEMTISDVSEGKFIVNFSCGEDTRSVEYAIGRAVNMGKDSVAFAAGKMDGTKIAEPIDGKISVPFDFSNPLDIGPYTVYARAISASGEVSTPVKAQVCALKAGLTLEHLSRSYYGVKASYHSDEFITVLYCMTSYNFNNYYDGSEENLKNEMIKNSDTEPIMQDGYIYMAPCLYYMDYDKRVTGLDEKMILGFVTHNGSGITGAHVIELPLPEKNPSVPAPDEGTIEIDMSQTFTDEYGGNYVKVNVSKGSGTEIFFYVQFSDTKDGVLQFGKELMENWPFFSSPEEALRWNIISGLFGYRGIAYLDDIEARIFYSGKDLETGEPYEIRNTVLLYCPINSNGEPGELQIVQFTPPEDWFSGTPAACLKTKPEGIVIQSYKIAPEMF